LPPRNITEGVTTLRKGYVDVWIHWQKPHYSDIPIWKYKVSDIPIWKYKVSDIPIWKYKVSDIPIWKYKISDIPSGNTR